ncbi:hypothetical protein TSUD_404420 [Trifolium subterraneum]|uniref:Zinc finger LSD1-type domain-containing protein n=1 Tax=Trifolium subterraneum TaxID=3900 RepID=A0A2Z6NUL3_TRISU|nr:hypothetical protein TSUD_404420 [Trifolium subterraneum]
MRSHIMCSGCRNLLLYPRGASNVCCALCNTITPVLPPGIFSFAVSVIKVSGFEKLSCSVLRMFSSVLIAHLD